MNVALMINTLQFGGAEKVFSELSIALVRRGVNVTFFLMDERDITYTYAGNIHTIGRIYKKDAPWMALLSWQHLIGAAEAKRKYCIDVTISAMEYLNLVNVLTGRDAKITTLHNHRFQHEVTPTAKDRFIEKVFAKLSRRCRTIVCVSRAIEEKARALYPGAQVETIYNCFDLNALRAQADTGTPEVPYDFGPETLVHAGRLTKQKAQDRLLRAFAQVRQNRPAARLLILGGGEEEAALQHLARDLSITDSVTFLGFVKNPYYYIRCAQAFVLSSDYEGFGNVIVESMAVGTPVISTDCKSGPREILAPDTPITALAEGVEWAQYGALTALSDEALAQAMEALLADDALRAKYAALALKRVEDFSLDTAVNRWMAVIGGCRP